jgi:hypothetical protein
MSNTAPLNVEMKDPDEEENPENSLSTILTLVLRLEDCLMGDPMVIPDVVISENLELVISYGSNLLHVAQLTHKNKPHQICFSLLNSLNIKFRIP